MDLPAEKTGDKQSGEETLLRDGEPVQMVCMRAAPLSSDSLPDGIRVDSMTVRS